MSFRILASSRLLCPIPEASRYKAWVCGRSVPGIAGSNLARGVDVCCECCMFSGRVLCVGLFTLPEESYRVWRALSVIVKPRQRGGPGPIGALKQVKIKMMDPL